MNSNNNFNNTKKGKPFSNFEKDSRTVPNFKFYSEFGEEFNNLNLDNNSDYENGECDNRIRKGKSKRK